jgi:hypothetical protein
VPGVAEILRDKADDMEIKGDDDAGAAGVARGLATLYERKENAVAKAKAITEAASKEFRATISETTKEDRPLVYFKSDILEFANKHQPILLVYPGDPRSSRELLEDLKDKQDQFVDSFVKYQHLVCYSHNQGRLVHARKINSKWEWYRYYTDCSKTTADKMMRSFDAPTGPKLQAVDQRKGDYVTDG